MGSKTGEGPRRASTSSNKATTTQSQIWTTTRCHRLIRPLTSKLTALKSLQLVPSVIATANAPDKPKDKKDPAELAYDPKHDEKRTSRRSGKSFDSFGGYRRDQMNRASRTYGRSTARQNSGSQVAVPVVTNLMPNDTTTAEEGLQDTTEGPSKKGQAKKDLDPTHPEAMLQALKPSTHPELYHLYTGIYAAFEIILTTTKWDHPKGPEPMKVLAARRVAQCILATMEETEFDDVWYDAAADIGAQGEYLREIVRWQAIEIVREAIYSNQLPSQQKTGLGLPGVLIGLCKFQGAHAEAESLLRTMVELYPLSENTSNPSLVSLMTSWRTSRESMFRIAKDMIIQEGSPVSLGNTTFNNVLRIAMENIERCHASANLVSRALEVGFGVWGHSYVTTAANARKESSRRKGGRRSEIKHPKDSIAPKTGKIIPRRIGERAEEICLHLTQRLVAECQISRNTNAISLIRFLARGFLVQDEAMRTSTEEEWETWYPLAAKVTILLQDLGRDQEQDPEIVKELTRCLYDLCESIGKQGLQSLGEFIASCYESLYTSIGKSVTGNDELKSLVSCLLAFVATGAFPVLHSVDTPDSTASPTKPGTVPKTPLKPAVRMVTFTPNKRLDEAAEKERYYMSQLALHIALGSSALKFTKNNEKWYRWIRHIEYQIIGMKVRTPARPEAAARKGWRWEEGLDEWVEVGGTPVEKKRTQMALNKVEISIDKNRKRTWRNEYQIFSSYDERSEDVEDTNTTSDEEQDQESAGVMDEVDEGEDTVVEEDQDTVVEEDSDGDIVMPSSPPPIAITKNNSAAFLDSDEDEETKSTTKYLKKGFYHSTPGKRRLTVPNTDDDESQSDEADYSNPPKYYMPTPAKPPRSARRSPRSTQLIKNSLRAFSVVPGTSSPARSSPFMQRSKAFNRAASGLRMSSPLPKGDSEEEDDDEEEDKDTQGNHPVEFTEIYSDSDVEVVEHSQTQAKETEDIEMEESAESESEAEDSEDEYIPEQPSPPKRPIRQARQAQNSGQLRTRTRVSGTPASSPPPLPKRKLSSISSNITVNPVKKRARLSEPLPKKSTDKNIGYKEDLLSEDELSIPSSKASSVVGSIAKWRNNGRNSLLNATAKKRRRATLSEVMGTDEFSEDELAL
ncbi:hypothetical protein BZA77DRAFT_311866 [Pyronema omphalodes]|nr:hypothetical protein BZA77DRAFT_311866 [Pyronema omphalodes]